MRTWCAFFLGGLHLSFTASLRADVPPSPVPLTEMRSFQAPLAIKPGAANDPQMYLRLPSQIIPPRPPRHVSTFAAGIALTLAFAFAGLWLIYGGRRRKIGGGILLLIGVMLIGLSGCPPRSYDPPTYNEQLGPPVSREDGILEGEALLQLEDNRSAIEVVVPSEQLTSFAQAQSEK